MRTGTVKIYHDEKHYAFIVDDETKTDVYTQQKKFADTTERFTIGERVQYELKEKCGKNKNEVHAINVKSIF